MRDLHATYMLEAEWWTFVAEMSTGIDGSISSDAAYWSESVL